MYSPPKVACIFPKLLLRFGSTFESVLLRASVSKLSERSCAFNWTHLINEHFASSSRGSLYIYNCVCAYFGCCSRWSPSTQLVGNLGFSSKTHFRSRSRPTAGDIFLACAWERYTYTYIHTSVCVCQCGGRYIRGLMNFVSYAKLFMYVCVCCARWQRHIGHIGGDGSGRSVQKSWME